MASFDQNQQNQFNMNSSIEQVKQFQAELDKATTSIGAAELAAEEALQQKKLDNLLTFQNEKLKKLKELTKIEEDRLYELADISLSLSELQFEARKKEIQKELKLARDAMEELANEADKRKSAKKPSGQTKSSSITEDITAASKAKSASATTEEQKNVSQPELLKVFSSLDNTLKALQKTITAKSVSGPQIENDTPITSEAQTASPNNTNIQDKPQVVPKDESQYPDEANGLKKVKLGEKTLVDIINGLEINQKYFESLATPDKRDPTGKKTINPTLELLNGIIATGNIDEKGIADAKESGVMLPTEQLTQTTLDITGAWLESIEAATTAEEELIEFKKDLELNTQLIRLNKEEELRKGLADKERERLEKQANIEATIAFNKANADELMAQKLQDTRIGYAEEYAAYLLEAGKYAVDQEKFEKDKARKNRDAAKKNAVSGITDGLKKFGTGEFSMTGIKKSYSEYMGQRTAELKESGLDESSAKLSAQFELLAEAAGGLQAALDADVKKIADLQGFVDTRLQGSQINEQKGQSYWKQLLKDAKSIAGASPFIKQEKLVDNIKALVDKGISFDVKQRAFLMTIQEKVANTFDAADGTLLRLIRIQQQDTTAGRLGMESALNSFLNSMYETSEYLESVAAGVRSSLEEMQALMEGAAGTEVEYQIQKWMGSLYSVGMSQNAVQDIARAFGQIASGDISGLTGNGTGNLLIMAANEAGMSIADILQDGLNADETNKLMQAMVNYLAEIAETSSDSKVVQQQLANVYGIKASDLKSATNLATSIKDVSNQNLAYSGMLGQLEHMMNTIRHRTSISEGMTNMWDNMMYSMASTQASNPILYALPKMANLLRDVTGGSGIDLPFLNVHGFGVDLNTSVADLMSIASMAGTALGALGPVLIGLSDLTNSSVGLSMLNRAGISTSGKAPVIARGSAPMLQNLSGSSISESGYVGNASGDDVKNATLQDAEDSKKKQMVEAKDEETADDVATNANLAVVNIYNLLEEVAHGSQSLRVKVVSGGCNCINGTESELNNPIKNGTDNGNWVLTF